MHCELGAIIWAHRSPNGKNRRLRDALPGPFSSTPRLILLSPDSLLSVIANDLYRAKQNDVVRVRPTNRRSAARRGAAQRQSR